MSIHHLRGGGGHVAKKCWMTSILCVFRCIMWELMCFSSIFTVTWNLWFDFNVSWREQFWKAGNYLQLDFRALHQALWTITIEEKLFHLVVGKFYPGMILGDSPNLPGISISQCAIVQSFHIPLYWILIHLHLFHVSFNSVSK